MRPALLEKVHEAGAHENAHEAGARDGAHEAIDAYMVSPTTVLTLFNQHKDHVSA